MTIELECNFCRCHPETCNCNDYVIRLDGERVASGNDKPMMERIVRLAGGGADLLEALKEAFGQISPDTHKNTWERCRAAIAKATDGP